MAYWYYEVHRRLSVQSWEKLDEPPLNPSTIEEQIEGIKRSADGTKYHKNNWSKYSQGLRCPHPTLVERVNELVPGTEHVLNHPIWDCLRSEKRRYLSRQMLIGQLHPGIQNLLFEFDKIDGARSRQAIDQATLERLEEQPGLDALACLMLLLEEHEGQAIALDIGLSIYRVLLILCGIRAFEAIEVELFEILAERVFPFANNRKQSVSFNATKILLAASHLNAHVVRSMALGEAPMTWEGGVQTSISVLRESNGLLLQRLLSVPIKENGKVECAELEMMTLLYEGISAMQARHEERPIGSGLVEQLRRLHAD
ncbi:MAG TPA: hypothetical protein VNZ68_12170 [Rhodocyclaceae bacterium]|nr:hypothetical protein [Rhodocyclaceae bacterium]